MESSKLKIGVLLDGVLIQAWQAECLRQIMHSGIAEIAVLIFNKSPKTSGTQSPYFYRLYRKLDRLIFKTKADAFESCFIETIFDSSIAKISVQPIQEKYTDTFPEATLEDIQDFDLDILLRFGFRILKGPILQVAKLGVWSFHHGDPKAYRGGPPAFWEVMHGQSISSVVLMRINENLDQGQILYQSFTQTDPVSVQRNANKLFWLSSFFVERTLLKLHQIGRESWEKDIANQAEVPKAALLRPPKAWEMVSLIFKLISRTIKRKVRELRFQAHWKIGKHTCTSEKKDLKLSSEEVLNIEHPDPSAFYWADPFPLVVEGKEYVLVEEFDKNAQKGRIACLEWIQERLEYKSKMDEPWHLSYPFVWQEDGDLLVIPEAAESGKIYAYRALDFPKAWIRDRVIFDGEAYDPTLLKKDGRYWLFINQKAHPACSSFDELYLYYSDKLEPYSWVSHPQNPIVSDVRKSRPAGRIFEKDGKLFRPAQDSGLRYGHRIHIQEILLINTDNYQERTLRTIEPKTNSQVLGIHTYNESPQGIYLDMYFRR